MTKNDFNEFVLTRGEFAKRIGKTKNAVRLAMRRGGFDGQYRFDGNKFLFKDPDRTRDTIVNKHGHNEPPKRKINRGNHYNANYPNESFRKYNEAKMLRAVNERDPNFIKDYKDIKKEFKKQKIEQNLKASRKLLTPDKNYGRMLYGNENVFWEADYKKKLSQKKSSSFHLTGKPYHEAKKDSTWSVDPKEDGSVDIDLSRSKPSNNLGTEPRFKSKVDEEIWRLKKKR
jgi:hypothetical protein